MSGTVNAITRNTQDLERLEGVITRNMQSFYEVGRALMEIRDNELYEKVRGIATFETYCKQRWDFKRTYAFYLIESAKVIDNVHNCEQKPTSESQCRPLINLEPDEQRKVWQAAVDTAKDGKVTAAHVQKTVKEMMKSTSPLPPEPKKPVRIPNQPMTLQEPVGDGFQSAFEQMLNEIKRAKESEWKETSHKAALDMMQVLLAITG